MTSGLNEIVVAISISIYAMLPAKAIEEKAIIADSLRKAAEQAGCETPTVEVDIDLHRDVMEIIVRCRSWKP